MLRKVENMAWTNYCFVSMIVFVTTAEHLVALNECNDKGNSRKPWTDALGTDKSVSNTLQTTQQKILFLMSDLYWLPAYFPSLTVFFKSSLRVSGSLALDQTTNL